MGDGQGCKPDPIANLLQKEINFQNRWRRNMCVIHTFTSVGMIAFSAGAAFTGNLDGTIAAVFAAIATVCAGVEKGLKISEKWKLHLKIQTRLKIIKLKYDKKQFSQQSEIIKEISDVMEEYAKELEVEDSAFMEIRNLKEEMKEIRSQSSISSDSQSSNSSPVTGSSVG